MAKYQKHFSTKTTPQGQPIPGTDQVENSAGGFVWGIDDWGMLDRFLILGNEGGSYYASEQKMTIENAGAVLRCLNEDGRKAINRIVGISESGRAPKNDPALFALAIASGVENEDTRSYALEMLPRVARIGTHLFTFMEYAREFRGRGRGLRRGIANWYLGKEPDRLAYQLLKYQQRGTYSHKDTLMIGRPGHETEQPTDAQKPMLEFIVTWLKDKTQITDELIANCPPLVRNFVDMQRAEKKEHVINIIENEADISWEMVPTEFQKEPEVWEALLPNNLPLNAMIRNLARMTANGLIAPLSGATNLVSEKLNKDHILKSRVHPVSILGAMATYQLGHGVRGNLEWNPVAKVIDALDNAFYDAFDNVKSTGKRTLLALDVSGSMDWGEIAGMPGLTPRVGSAAMALITAKVETNHAFCAFSHEMIPIDISPKQRLDDVITSVDKLPFGGTDCALPMIYALDKVTDDVDTFVIYTDDQTWFGDIHPAQALRKYRDKRGIPSKLVVVGMMANQFSIADPNDAGMMDVVGFDTNAPNLISDFSGN